MACIATTALLLSDCGYAPANPMEWIDRERRPSPETLETVEGYSLLRTDRNGWIELTTDGEQMWVEVERR